MLKKLAVLSLAAIAGILVACGGRGPGSTGPGGMSYALPPMEDLAITATVPKHAIGEEEPSEGLGSVRSYGSMVGGFTQTHYSQTLAFPPGTKITIHNLSKVNQHTLDVVKEISGHTASFPMHPTLSMSPHGHGKLAVGYASGIINPGKSVTVTLDKEGTYLIGCAFHYAEGMRDVLVVKNGARPGPQASPMPPPTTSPTHTPGGGW